MATTMSPAPLPVQPTSRRQSSHSSQNERHNRSQSSALRHDRSPNDAESTSSPAASNHRRTTSMSNSQQRNLAQVHRRDYEQLDLARGGDAPRPDSLATRADGALTPRTEVPPPTMHRQSSDATRHLSQAQSSNYTSTNHNSRNLPIDQTQRRRTAITGKSGTWNLGKTIGAGSMGKVKLARHQDTNEQVAIKIIPRQSTDEHATRHDKERADHSKEVRTSREAAIVSLLHHPYICGMRDVVKTNYHWYMFFEYVNGGQMLDYIISHGRLKEKQARKFGRQIASALDYCHKNSIAHRDLKIENILISKTGDIKIIDFGLSNLFSPKSLLKTFCGSLYFAAPELLQAKQYTGPEVDIWSFGIVLYVLVCGKVPFDDQSMPKLHAKIKQGNVEYPTWLSQECKHLISRMLVTDPKQRANMPEIFNHAWMNKGFTSPPESHLPYREPLSLPLDRKIIESMSGFEFGTFEQIEREMTRIIESVEYRSAVQFMVREPAMITPSSEKKRGVFDFYKRRNSTTSKENLPGNLNEVSQAGPDPLHAFSPLLSIYYLAKEKHEREQLATRQDSQAQIEPITIGTDAPIADIPAPTPAYTNTNSYELSGEVATGGRARPRARTHGEDEISSALQNATLQSPTETTTPATPSREKPILSSRQSSSLAGGLLRRFSTRRTPRKEEPTTPKASEKIVEAAAPSPSSTSGASTLRRGLSMRKSRSQRPESMMVTPTYKQTPEIVEPAEKSAPIRSSFLGRSTSVTVPSASMKKQYRQSSYVAPALEAPLTSESDQSSMTGPRIGFAANLADKEKRPPPSPIGTKSRTKSAGHSRSDSNAFMRLRRPINPPEALAEETPENVLDGDLTEGESGAIKPVYLKGLFSVSTTSSRPVTYIRQDIIRVLRQLNVDFTEIKSGFSCTHSPSISANRAQGEASSEKPNTPKAKHTRRLSFGNFLTADKESGGPNDRRAPEKLNSRAISRNREESPSQSLITSDDSGDERGHRRRVPAAAPGETTTHVIDDTYSDLVLRFEILLVKVPLISLHGIQFKKVQGGTWQYKEMAQRILDALRL